MTQETGTRTISPFSGRYIEGIGRRKMATARVKLFEAPAGQGGQIIVNGRPFREVFTRLLHWVQVLRPLEVAGATQRFNVSVKVSGGGISGWAGAIAHGLARALVAWNPELKPVLRQAGLLTRDPRVKERQKYGLKRARKAPQYSKR